MKTLKFAFAVIATLVVLSFVVGLCLPSDFQVSRATVMNAPPEAIYPFVASAKQWAEWSAWNPKAKPEMTFSYEGPELGKGSAVRLSNQKAPEQGSGVLTITEANPKTGVHYQVLLDNGFRIDGTFAFEPSGAGTKVTWTDRGEFKNPWFRYLRYVMDRSLGGAFEQGLNELKKHAEGAPAAATPATPATATAPASPTSGATATPAAP